MMNTIMCSKSWLGFQEITKEELAAEEDLLVLARLQECSVDGDILVFPNDSLDDEDI